MNTPTGDSTEPQDAVGDPAPRPLGGNALHSARTDIAGLAKRTMSDAHTRVVGQLQEAIRERAVIEQAKGILMAQQRCTAEEAFNLLTRAAQRESRELGDIARDLVTGLVTKPNGDTG